MTQVSNALLLITFTFSLVTGQQLDAQVCIDENPLCELITGVQCQLESVESLCACRCGDIEKYCPTGMKFNPVPIYDYEGEEHLCNEAINTFGCDNNECDEDTQEILKNTDCCYELSDALSPAATLHTEKYCPAGMRFNPMPNFEHEDMDHQCEEAIDIFTCDNNECDAFAQEILKTTDCCYVLSGPPSPSPSTSPSMNTERSGIPRPSPSTSPSTSPSASLPSPLPSTSPSMNTERSTGIPSASPSTSPSMNTELYVECPGYSFEEDTHCDCDDDCSGHADTWCGCAEAQECCKGDGADPNCRAASAETCLEFVNSETADTLNAARKWNELLDFMEERERRRLNNADDIVDMLKKMMNN